MSSLAPGHFRRPHARADPRLGAVDGLLDQLRVDNVDESDKAVTDIKSLSVTAAVANGDTLFVCAKPCWLFWMKLPQSDKDDLANLPESPEPQHLPCAATAALCLRVSKWNKSWNLFPNLGQGQWTNVHLDYDLLVLACGRRLKYIRLIPKLSDGAFGIRSDQFNLSDVLAPRPLQPVSMRAFKGRVLVTSGQAMAELAYKPESNLMYMIRKCELAFSPTLHTHLPVRYLLKVY
jgi:hypothetical protein